jgi:outer membrane protein TolC
VVQDVLANDSEYQGAVLDEKMALIKKQAVDSLWRNALEVSPYTMGYKLNGGDNTSSSTTPNFTEQGIQWGLTQFTPWATQIRLGYDQIMKNDRKDSLNKDNGLQISLVQPLWKNQFGEVYRSQQNQSEYQAQAAVLTSQSKQKLACSKAANAYAEAWSEMAKQQFVVEAYKLSSDLSQKAKQMVQRGQISQLDWLGVQSDHLNLQTKRAHSEQAVHAALLRLQKLSPKFHPKTQTLKPPQTDFLKLAGVVQAQRAPVESIAEKSYQAILKGLEEQRMADASNALPDLDFKLSHKWNEGQMVNAVATKAYNDREWAASLNLVWKFNDFSVSATEQVSRLQVQKTALLLEEARRQRLPQFAETQENLLSLQTQLQLETERSVLLGKITDEHKKRFFQGRLEFQDYLRMKEQWLESQQRQMEQLAQYWKLLLAFALEQDGTVDFCGGAR